MNKVHYLFFLLFFSNLIVQVSGQQQGYKIDVTVSGISDTNAILCHYKGTAMYPCDTTRLDKSGHGTFYKQKKLIQGLYLIYLPNGSYFEVLVGEDQDFALKTDTSNYLQNLSFQNSVENVLFAEFKLFIVTIQKKMKTLQDEFTTAKSEKQKQKIRSKMNDLNAERKEKLNKLISENRGKFIATFLQATVEIEVPDTIKEDKNKAYSYFKEHYFDNLDLSDVRLLYSPLYEEKLINYLDKVVAPIPDSLIKEIDMILDKANSDSILYQHVLITLFKKYVKSNMMGMDAIWVHLAENYYIKDAWWSSEKQLQEIKERASAMKPLLIGKIAPNEQFRYVPAAHFEKAKDDTALKKYPHAGSFFNVADIDAKYTVLLFWKSTCGHCKKAVEDAYSLYRDTLKAMNVKVIAVSTLFGEDGKEKWVDYINKNELYDWINAWNPYDSKYMETYDLRTTPQIYVLNKNKEIVGKKIEANAIADIISAYERFAGKK